MWLCAFLMSCVYQRPLLHLTPYDRTNPRLTDITCALGIVLILPRLRRDIAVPTFLRVYAALVAVYSLCAVIWAGFLLPWQYGKFSLYFAARGVQWLIALYIAAKIPLDQKQKRLVHWLLVAGGIFVACYSIPQYLSPVSRIELMPGKYATVTEGIVVGPFGVTYFDVAMFSPLSCVMTLALIPTLRGTLAKLAAIAAAGFICWPAWVCGSRSGPAFLGIAVAVWLVLVRRGGGLRSVGLAVAAVAILALAAAIVGATRATTAERMLTFQEGRNSVWSRVMVWRAFDLGSYKYAGLPVPFIGAGYRVAPTYSESGLEGYRVGYGFHNVYLKSFEQGGTAAFVLFLAFLWCCWRATWRMRAASDPSDVAFAAGVTAFFVAMLVVGMVGVGSWQGSVGTYFTAIVMIGSRPAPAARQAEAR